MTKSIKTPGTPAGTSPPTSAARSAAAADAELLGAILADDTSDGDRVRLIWSYYHDRDRADRTSRELLYLHLGMLCGMILKSERP